MLPFISAIIAKEKELWLAKQGTVRILSVDPGKITGVAVLWFRPEDGEIVGWGETLITHDEVKQTMDLMACLRTLADCGRVFIVVENFVVDQVNMSPDFLSPVRIGRRFEFGAYLMSTGELGVGPVMGCVEMPVAWNSRARKADFSDARLKVLGFYTPGPDHRRDATRHALVRWKQLKLELPRGVKTSASWWEPGLQNAQLKIQRNFNGVPVNTKGQRSVTKEDMERMKVEKMPGAKRDWVETKQGFVQEHDPRTESGIAPMSPERLKEYDSALAAVEKTASPQPSKPPAKRKKRLARRLV
jgi:hypothetical protein